MIVRCGWGLLAFANGREVLYGSLARTFLRSFGFGEVTTGVRCVGFLMAFPAVTASVVILLKIYRRFRRRKSLRVVDISS